MGTVTEMKAHNDKNDDKISNIEETLDMCEQMNDEKVPEKTDKIYDITKVPNVSDDLCNKVGTLSDTTDAKTEDIGLVKEETKKEKLNSADANTCLQKVDIHVNDNLIDLSDHENNSVQ